MDISNYKYVQLHMCICVGIHKFIYAHILFIVYLYIHIFVYVQMSIRLYVYATYIYNGNIIVIHKSRIIGPNTEFFLWCRQCFQLRVCKPVICFDYCGINLGCKISNTNHA